MAKTRDESLYLCNKCGAKSHKWVGQCATCGTWNSLELSRSGVGTLQQSPVNRGPQKLSDVPAGGTKRYQIGLTELDRVLGGGIVPGSVVLLGGEPGIGKSTLALLSLIHI